MGRKGRKRWQINKINIYICRFMYYARVYFYIFYIMREIERDREIEIERGREKKGDIGRD